VIPSFKPGPESAPSEALVKIEIEPRMRGHQGLPEGEVRRND
jgi:hypothetical protein